MDDRRSEPGLDVPEAPVASLERVTGRVDRVAIDRRRVRDDVWASPGGPGLLDDIAATLGLDRSDLVALVRRMRPVLVVTTVISIGTVVAPHAPWLLIVPAMVGVLGLLGGRRVGFSFADGLVGYREPPWPRGVQEEYDVSYRLADAGSTGARPTGSRTTEAGADQPA